MPEFLTLIPPDEALKILIDHIPPDPLSRGEISSVQIDTAAAVGRVSAVDIRAAQPLPDFARATVDGYALRAENTFGASESLPACLSLIGEVKMGDKATISVGMGECILMHTGGMLPPGADAVAMLENCQTMLSTGRPDGDQIEVLKAVASGENVIRAGEDVAAGEVVLQAGQRLRAVEIGGLMALGITRVAATAKPRVGIISTGNEIIPPDATPTPGQVRDINAYSLSALVEGAGGVAIRCGIVPDREEEQHLAAREALAGCDLLLITAGSSAGARDLTAQVIGSLGKPGVLVHGVNIRPGKPTILGVCDGKPVIGLPGNPVSALVAARLFVTPVIELLSGMQTKDQKTITAAPKAYVQASLTVNLASETGREDWAPVRLVQNPAHKGLSAEPIFGKSNLIFTFARADGLVRVPASANGLNAGEIVEVFLL